MSVVCLIISGILISIGLDMYLYNLKKIKNNNYYCIILSGR